MLLMTESRMAPMTVPSLGSSCVMVRVSGSSPARRRPTRLDWGGTRQGWLVGLDRDIGKNFRIGAGYNFTEFSDFDYDHEGWFLNMVGMY